MFGKALSFLTPPTGSLIGAGDLEAGSSGGAPSAITLCHGRGTHETLTPPRPARFFFDDLSDDESRHFLDFCFLCKKYLSGNRDIYMYRGDTPFCSVECRLEQIEIDEARERNWKLAMMEQQQKHKSASPTKSHRFKVRHGTIVPA